MSPEPQSIPRTETDAVPSEPARKFALPAAIVILLIALAAFLVSEYRRHRQVASVGEVVFTSEPAGASVFLDDGFVGKTPVTLPLVKYGSHSLRLTKDRHVPLRKLIDVGQKRVEVRERLSPEPQGGLYVTSEPSGAEVYVDGDRKGETPLSIEELQPGVHTVRIQRDGCRPWESSIPIERGQESKVHRRLEHTVQAYYEAQIGADPRDLSNYVELAHHHTIRQDFGQAAEVLGNALRLAFGMDRRSGPVRRLYQEMYNAYSGQYDYGDDQAIARFRSHLGETLERAARENYATEELVSFLGKLYRETGQLDKAIALYEGLVKQKPLDGDRAAALGGLYVKKGTPEKAVTVLRRALRRDRKNSEALYSLGLAYLKLGERLKARIKFKVALLYCNDKQKAEEIRAALDGVK